ASHPAVFVLAGTCVAIFVEHWKANRRRPLTQLGVLGAIWGIGFVVNYWIFLRPLVANEGLQNHWASGFMPWNILAIPWLFKSYRNIFANVDTMWLRFPTLAAVLCAVAMIYL